MQYYNTGAILIINLEQVYLRLIKNPVKHLRWGVWKPLTFLTKTSILGFLAGFSIRLCLLWHLCSEFLIRFFVLRFLQE